PVHGRPGADPAGRPGDRPGPAPGTARRDAGPPHPGRIRPAGTPGPPAAGGLYPGTLAGLRRSQCGHPRQGTAAQTGRRPDPHRARGRVRAGGALVSTLAHRLRDTLPRPLDPFRSLKLKIGILVVLAIAAAVTVFWYGIGWWPPTTTLTAFAVALLVTQVLAHGMTSPLREMTAAARAMARGDYSRRVRASSRDEV